MTTSRSCAARSRRRSVTCRRRRRSRAEPRCIRHAVRLLGGLVMKKPGKRELPPKSPTQVKGGGLTSINENITLVRGAKPEQQRDLPPRKTVKGGAKMY